MCFLRAFGQLPKNALTRYGVYDIMKLRGANATKQEHRWELSTAQVHMQLTTTTTLKITIEEVVIKDGESFPMVKLI